MTGCDAFLRAIAANPADDTARLVYADWLDENSGTDLDRATAEFIRLCFARTRYEVKVEITDDDAKARRKRVPGWREWLVGTGEQRWWRCDGRPPHADLFPSLSKWPKVYAPSAANWHRLVPRFRGMCQGKTMFRREGRRVLVRANDHGDATLEFGRGFLARVEFDSWRSADRLLPTLLADQPLVRPGIVGQPYRSRPVRGKWFLGGDAIGPLGEALRAMPREPQPGEPRGGRERARLRLARVMLARAADMANLGNLTAEAR